jgi:hypothetical protein
MEPGGRNQWQPGASAWEPKRLKQAKTVAVGCGRLPFGAHSRCISKRGRQADE